ncbi:hypothetical protein [Catenulispora pinisilvae]|uniref:hypothetical protein n=1 Tax=Catenulispora pinisilvae TaxID=2705253 RepID=UPI00189262CA|nr:hypothetical protein [Catenulispora pinisilvae]
MSTTATDWGRICAETLAEQVREFTRTRLVEIGVEPEHLRADYAGTRPFAVRMTSPAMPDASVLVTPVGYDRFALSCGSTRAECSCRAATWTGRELIGGLYR